MASRASEKMNKSFYQNMASRASKKMNKSPRSSRCWPSCHAAGKQPLLHQVFFAVFWNVIHPATRPSGAAQGAHYPAGTRGDIQAVAAPKLPWVHINLKELASRAHTTVAGLVCVSMLEVSLLLTGIEWGMIGALYPPTWRQGTTA